ncbi:gata-binding factor-c [Culex quinquefasciatus]|uniref:Gata-binding factor-c n=1 Tax=Culex quinquefasciatus TaxID=7176 RepID=B0WMU5_CULQU|nr:gata-binding factor-c [Culex quinquefasciatus]|eukprot:XP_001850029.1 gata-binding factor-c [Culex quinquefasciatus]
MPDRRYLCGHGPSHAGDARRDDDESIQSAYQLIRISQLPDQRVLAGLAVNRPLTMKKEGIQTRNRKLSSKSKKKKGGMGAGSCLPLGGHHHHHLGDLMKPLDHNHKSAFPGAFPGAMGQHSHLSGGLHPAHTHMHGGWYATGMGALGTSTSLQSGFGSASTLGGGVVPHSQSYHLGLNSMVSSNLLL